VRATAAWRMRLWRATAAAGNRGRTSLLLATRLAAGAKRAHIRQTLRIQSVSLPNIFSGQQEASALKVVDGGQRSLGLRGAAPAPSTSLKRHVSMRAAREGAGGAQEASTCLQQVRSSSRPARSAGAKF